MKINEKVYLGDYVYAIYDSRNVVLTTEDGVSEDPSNSIVLDPEVITALNKFMDDVRLGHEGKTS